MPTAQELAACRELTRDFRGLPLTVPVAALCACEGTLAERLAAACAAAEAWAVRHPVLPEQTPA